MYFATISSPQTSRREKRRAGRARAGLHPSKELRARMQRLRAAHYGSATSSGQGACARKKQHMNSNELQEHCALNIALPAPLVVPIARICNPIPTTRNPL